MNQKLWDIAVEAPLKPLAYLQNNKGPHLKRGLSVLIPLGNRKVSGIVLGPSHQSIQKSQYKWKSIISILDDRPKLPEPYLKWIEWLSEYYVYPIGQIFKTTFPPLKKKGRRKTSILPQNIKPSSLTLTKPQELIAQKINQQTGFQVHLLYGVTGSGKTEVYFSLIEKTIQQQKQVLMLVPEISLTPQIIQRFVKKFGQKIAVIHSDLTPREKTNQWWNIIDKKQSILIGARSAIFCPIENLGLIVVDEEHEGSFKQFERLHYNARDASIMLAKLHNCPVVLGSATPSLETWHNTIKGKYQLHRLSKRFGSATLPQVTIEDMTCQERSDLPFWLSQTLYDKMQKHLACGNQVALFLNRRGDAQTVICTQCGECEMCPNCSVSLTVHHKVHLVCHYCNYHKNYDVHCKQCHADAMQNIGVGTSGIQKDLENLFSNKKILRADRDQISNRKDMETFIDQVSCRQADILVGTQMIAKGLDFRHLTLVGVVAADVSLNLPDFRASERTFQLLVQMAGRSGRHNSQGEVVIQTFNYKNLVIQQAIKHQYEDFASQELAIRQGLCYPPFYRMALIRVRGASIEKIESALFAITRFAKEQAKKAQEEYFEVLGPAPAPLSKIKSQYRYQILIKSSKSLWLSQFCQHLKTHLHSCLDLSSPEQPAFIKSLSKKQKFGLTPKKSHLLKKPRESLQMNFNMTTDLKQEEIFQGKTKFKKDCHKLKSTKVTVDIDIDPLQML